ncbi:MAG: hypothetical protein ACJAZ1_002749 [Yoonia sp.]|jgi:hypothetical protein
MLQIAALFSIEQRCSWQRSGLYNLLRILFFACDMDYFGFKKSPHSCGLLIECRSIRQSIMNEFNVDLLIPLLGINTHDYQPQKR